MAEQQPPGIQEGDQAPTSIPGSQHSQTAALDNLNNTSTTSNNTTQTTDSTALGDAMKNLNVGGSVKKDGDIPRNVKVEVGDVNLLVEQLDVSKAKATELLKANDADPVKAVRAWIAA